MTRKVHGECCTPPTCGRGARCRRVVCFVQNVRSRWLLRTATNAAGGSWTRLSRLLGVGVAATAVDAHQQAWQARDPPRGRQGRRSASWEPPLACISSAAMRASLLPKENSWQPGLTFQRLGICGAGGEGASRGVPSLRASLRRKSRPAVASSSPMAGGVDAGQGSASGWAGQLILIISSPGQRLLRMRGHPPGASCRPCPPARGANRGGARR